MGVLTVVELYIRVKIARCRPGQINICVNAN